MVIIISANYAIPLDENIDLFPALYETVRVQCNLFKQPSPIPYFLLSVPMTPIFSVHAFLTPYFPLLVLLNPFFYFSARNISICFIPDQYLLLTEFLTPVLYLIVFVTPIFH